MRLLVSKDLILGWGPLTYDVWTWGQCGLNLFQYLAVGVPVICSPGGANKEIVSDGEVGLWACDTREWIEKLRLLIDKPELRKKMGEKVRESIEKQYSL
jgi:glycosyltransferase involved in cell wall biosynthesis